MSWFIFRMECRNVIFVAELIGSNMGLSDLDHLRSPRGNGIYLIFAVMTRCIQCGYRVMYRYYTGWMGTD